MSKNFKSEPLKCPSCRIPAKLDGTRNGGAVQFSDVELPELVNFALMCPRCGAIWSHSMDIVNEWPAEATFERARELVLAKRITNCQIEIYPVGGTEPIRMHINEFNKRMGLFASESSGECWADIHGETRRPLK